MKASLYISVKFMLPRASQDVSRSLCAIFNVVDPMVTPQLG